MKHTPGPWKFVSTDTGHHIMDQHWGHSVAVTMDPHDGSAARQKNAQLIAAAPELLQALKRCAALLARYPQHDDAWAQARAAIDRATAEPIAASLWKVQASPHFLGRFEAINIETMQLVTGFNTHDEAQIFCCIRNGENHA